MSKIVHVDNSGFFRKLIKTFLLDKGHESENFSRGEDAIDIVMEGNTVCVITGMELADMNGEEFIKRLLVNTQDVPVIVITSSDNELQFEKLRTLGVRAIIPKSGRWKEDLAEHLAIID